MIHLGRRQRQREVLRSLPEGAELLAAGYSYRHAATVLGVRAPERPERPRTGELDPLELPEETVIAYARALGVTCTAVRAMAAGARGTSGPLTWADRERYLLWRGVTP